MFYTRSSGADNTLNCYLLFSITHIKSPLLQGAISYINPEQKTFP